MLWNNHYSWGFNVHGLVILTHEFTSPRTFDKVIQLSCIVMQQTSYRTKSLAHKPANFDIP